MLGLPGGSFLPGRIRARGHARLIVCRYPSLKIKLDKAALTTLGYSTLNDLKLVVQCSDVSTGTDYLRREKLMYGLHALVSPFHLRTLPVRLIVVGGETLEAFLVESEEQLEARYQAHLVTSGRVSTSGLQRAAYVNLCLFNYLILNTDWNVFNRHNVECFQLDNSRDLVAIPYDFDYSGMVAAAYALPHTSQDIASVYQPKWLGRHVSETELKEGAAVLLALEARLRGHIDRCQGLTDRDRDQLLKRMDKFYAVLKSEKKLLGLLGH